MGGMNGDQHPYREAGPAPRMRPIELESRVTSIDLTNGPVAPFVSTKGSDVSIEPALPGARMSGLVPNWVRSVQLGDFELPDFGIRMAFRLDGEPNAMVRVWFRHFKIGNTALGYVLTMRPLVRQYRVTRYAGPDVDPLVEWSNTPFLNGPGARNVVEVAARGEQIMVVCNDQLLTLLNDATFARGAVSVGGTGTSPRDAIIFEGVDLWTVRPR